MIRNIPLGNGDDRPTRLSPANRWPSHDMSVREPENVCVTRVSGDPVDAWNAARLPRDPVIRGPIAAVFQRSPSNSTTLKSDSAPTPATDGLPSFSKAYQCEGAGMTTLHFGVSSPRFRA